MPDDLDALKRREEAEAEQLSETAQRAGAGAISKTTVAAAVAVIRAVQPDRHRGAIGEPAADLRDVRNDPALIRAMANDMRVAQQQAFILLRDALIVGYRTEANGTKLDGASVIVTIDDEDRAALTGYPVLGFTVFEHASDLAWRLRMDLLGVLGQPLTGQIDPTKIPSAMGEAAAAHGKRLGGGVSEAYFAGVQAAGIALGQALVGR